MNGSNLGGDFGSTLSSPPRQAWVADAASPDPTLIQDTFHDIHLASFVPGENRSEARHVQLQPHFVTDTSVYDPSAARNQLSDRWPDAAALHGHIEPGRSQFDAFSHSQAASNPHFVEQALSSYPFTSTPDALGTAFGHSAIEPTPLHPWLSGEFGPDASSGSRFPRQGPLGPPASPNNAAVMQSPSRFNGFTHPPTSEAASEAMYLAFAGTSLADHELPLVSEAPVAGVAGGSWDNSLESPFWLSPGAPTGHFPDILPPPFHGTTEDGSEFSFEAEPAGHPVFRGRYH